MTSDLILEKYNNTVKQSIKQEFETERIIRISSQDDKFLLEQMEPPAENRETQLGRIAGTAARGAASGIAKHKAKTAAKKAFEKKAKPIIERTLSFFNLGKAVPVVGSIAALLSIGFDVVQFLSSMKRFTSKLLEYSGVELTGVRSLLGEYSIIDASAEDIEEVANSLRENITDEQRTELRELYYSVMEELKDILFDILMSIKELTVGLGFAAGIIVHLTPSERLVKNILFNSFRTLNELMDASPPAVQKIYSIYRRVLSSLNIMSVLPIIGFIQDLERIEAFMKIDEVIEGNSDMTSLDRVEDAIGYAARKGGALAQSGQEALQDIDTDLSDWIGNIKY